MVIGNLPLHPMILNNSLRLDKVPSAATRDREAWCARRDTSLRCHLESCARFIPLDNDELLLLRSQVDPERRLGRKHASKPSSRKDPRRSANLPMGMMVFVPWRACLL